MRKPVWALLCLVFMAAGLLAPSAFSQNSTTVSGQVTDSGGQAWNNGTYTFTLVPNPAYPSLGGYIWLGGAFNLTYSGSLSSSGAYSRSIPASVAFTPQPTWKLTVCPNATAPCYTVTSFQVFGSTQTVNVTPPAISINLSAIQVLNNGLPNSLSVNIFTRAYADAEITSVVQGATYFNVTAGVNHTCALVSGSTCSSWSSGGGGSGTVTSVGLTLPTWLTVAGSPLTTAGTLAVTPTAAQTSAQVIGTCGAATTFAPCSLTLGDLPNGIALLAGGNSFTGLQQFSAATFGLPQAASYAPTTLGLMGIDTTHTLQVYGTGAATASSLYVTTRASSTGLLASSADLYGLVSWISNPVAAGTTGFLSKYTGSAVLGNSLCDEGITTANTFTCSNTLGANFKLLTVGGSGAGAAVMTAGTAQGHATASTVTLEAPSAVTAYEIVLPGVAANGISRWANVSNVATQSTSELSGDATTSGSNALVLATVNSNVGSFTNANITVNGKGLVTAAANGSAGGSGIPFGAGAGSVNVMTVTTVPAVATNNTGTIVMVQPNLANTTTTPTLNVGGAGAQTIVKIGSGGAATALIAGDYGTTAQNLYFTFVSNGTNWILLNPLSSYLGTLFTLNATGNLEGTGTIGDVVAPAQIFASNSILAPKFEGAAAAQEVVFNGGFDSASTGGFTDAGGTFRGSDVSGATGVQLAGHATFRGGMATSASGTQGVGNTGNGFFAGATIHQWYVQAITASWTIQDSAINATNAVCVATNAVTPVYCVQSGIVPIVATAAVTIGDTVCTGATAGQITDSGGVGACTLGKEVGKVVATSGTYSVGSGSTVASVTATTTLPLIAVSFQ